MNFKTNQYNIVNNSPLSTQEIINIISEETILSYFNIIKNINFNNPFRQDKNPSVTCKIYKGKYVYKDWAMDKSYDIIGISALYLGHIKFGEDLSKEAFKETINDLKKIFFIGQNVPKLDLTYSNNKHIIHTKNDLIIKDVDYEVRIDVNIRNWEKYDFDYWKMPFEFLTKSKVYPLNYAIVNDKLTCINTVNNPTYGYYYKTETSFGKWKIYKPLDTNGYKWISNLKMQCPLYSDITTQSKVLCTSKKDAITINYLTGYTAYSYQSEKYIPDYLESKTICLFVDNDKTGIEYGEKLKQKFNLKLCFPEKKDVFLDYLSFDRKQLTEKYLNLIEKNEK